MNKQKQPIVVLSTGRTGTNFLSRLLSSLSMGDISHQGKFSRTANIVGNLGLCPDFEEWTKKTLKHLLGRVDRLGSTADPLLSIAYTLLLDHEKQSNQPKMLHVVRDPRNFVTSFMNWRKQRLRRMVLHHLTPFWQPNPWSIGDRGGFESYLKMSKFEHFCWIWAYKNNLFGKKIVEYEVESFFLKFETLMNLSDTENKSIETINAMSSFLNISETRLIEQMDKIPVLNSSLTKSFPKWTQWTNKQAKILEKHCGPLMKKYGYGSEPAWQKLISQ